MSRQQDTPHHWAAGNTCFVFGLICIWVVGLTPTKMNASKQSHTQTAPEHVHFQPCGCSFHGPEQTERRALQSHQLERGQAGRAHKSSWYLCNPVMLEVYHTRHCHLHAPKHSYHLQNLVIEGRGCKCLPHTREREFSWGTALLEWFPLPPIGPNLGVGF